MNRTCKGGGGQEAAVTTLYWEAGDDHDILRSILQADVAYYCTGERS